MKKISLLTLLSFALTSCYNYNYSPISHHNNFDLSKIDFSEDFKVGRSCAEYKNMKIDGSGLFDGSRSIIDAAKNADIKTVVFVEHEEIKEIFKNPIYCTIVYGRE